MYKETHICSTNKLNCLKKLNIHYPKAYNIKDTFPTILSLSVYSYFNMPLTHSYLYYLILFFIV